MKTKLAQIFNLELEIAGGEFNNVVYTGLINEEITFKAKYNLQKLLKKVQEEKSQYVEIEKELFKSLGAIEKEGNLIIPEFLEDGTKNPMIEKLITERTALMDQEIVLGELKFDIEDFNFKSKSTYPAFMSVAFDQ